MQAYMKGYLARKDLRGKLLDLRLKIQKSAANVNDGMRIINRLVAALSELLNMRSVSDILHICATLSKFVVHLAQISLVISCFQRPFAYQCWRYISYSFVLN